MATHDGYIEAVANAIPRSRRGNAVSRTVEDIMRERGIGKRWAYSILRQESEQAATSAPVPHNQRERVLTTLYRTKIRDSRKLNRALHDEGYEIDGHDTVKVLWSLQKTGHVKFREHQNPRYLYAIALTELGQTDAYRLIAIPEVEEPVTVPEEELADQDRPDLIEEEAVIAHPEPEPEPGPADFSRLGSYPAIRDLHSRSLKAQKLAEAARLLEEAGEDDLALNLMARTEFTPLEIEVIDMLEKLGLPWA